MIYSTLLKYGLALLAIVGVVVSVFALGYSHGSTTGYKNGWDAQQKTIDKFVNDENAQRVAQNNKINDLQAEAMKDQADIFNAKAQAAITRNTIVTQYKTRYVTIAQSCGWSIPTVQTINQLLSVSSSPTIPVSGVSK